MRSRNDEDDENDGSKINQRDLRIKVRHIARVRSVKEFPSEHRKDGSNSTQNTYFVIKMKQSADQQGNKFKFLAQSLAERDTIVLAIKSLLHDQGKNSHASRNSRDQNAESKIRSEDVNVNAFKALNISEQSKEEIRDQESAYSDEFFDSRDEVCHDREDDSERDTLDRFDPYSMDKKSFTRGKSRDDLYDTQNHRTVRNSSCRISTKKDHTDKHRRHSVATNGRYGNHRSYSLSRSHSRSRSQSRSRSPRTLERRRTTDRHGNKDVTFYDSLVIVEDEDMVTLAANCTSKATGMANLAAGCSQQTSGPWCTDDVCSATLKDFTDSMTGIFELKHNYNMNEMNGTNEGQRAVAEEYLSGFLSNNSNMGELLSVRDLWKVAAFNKHATGKELKRLHNRARNAEVPLTMRPEKEIQRMTAAVCSMIATLKMLDIVTKKEDLE
ncbi:unnamed protein product [Pseudo-nitzschia multistriata]|uniref:Uncharacterized protein n=1 Tax=Pseudo-nitzschia multistriata TaxID=183589 RepID=A0A448Z7F7_9STRA|nr:unnamed protein product [Pseudo-nitzschia multistriata]